MPAIKLLKAAGTAVLLAACAAVQGCSLLPAEEQALKPPLVKPVEDRLEVYEVARKDLVKELRGTAVFAPARLDHYRTGKHGGIVEHVSVSPGDRVQAGDELVVLDDEGLDIERKRKYVEVLRQERELREARAAGETEELRIKLLELEIARMEREAAEEAYRHKRLTASRGGTVVYAAEAEPGERVEGNRTLVTVADTTDMRLYHEIINRAAASEVQPGMDAAVTYQGAVYSGQVVQTPATAPLKDNPNAERDAGRLYIALTELPPGIALGDFADISIVTNRREKALVIPLKALRTYQSRTYVQVLDGKSRREADVETGIRTATEVEIVRGLEAGQLVVLQ